MTHIFGHRGLPNVYIENSLEGLNKAFTFCEYVETDVRLTKDNSLLLFHDPYINEYLIEELTVSEIESLLPGVSVEQIVLESRDQIKGKVNFEIKTEGTSPGVIDILFQKVSSISQNEDIISSFNWEALLSFKEIITSKYGIIMNNEDDLFEAKALSNHDDQLLFMVEKGLLNSRNFDLPKDKTSAWTVNDENEFKRLTEMGLFGIITDIPDTMQLYKK